MKILKRLFFLLFFSVILINNIDSYASLGKEEFPAPPNIPNDWQHFSEQWLPLLTQMRNQCFDIFSQKSPQLPEKIIYLTFDDGPNQFTSYLLDTISEYSEVKVTFFITAQSNKFLDLITREYSDGHALGIHSYNHFFEHNYPVEANFINDIMSTQQLIYEKTGTVTNLIRFPGGSRTARSYFYTNFESGTELLNRVGFQYYDWTVEPEYEYMDGHGIAQQAIFEIQKIETKGHPLVVLFHDTRYNSVESIREIIEWGLENGYQFHSITANTPVCHFDQ